MRKVISLLVTALAVAFIGCGSDSDVSAVGVAEGADHTAAPSAVTVAGSLQDELGCESDWDPACPHTGLIYDADDDAWQATLTVPAGTWEYKAALNGGWDENYGAGAVADGPNVALTLDEQTEVTFLYQHASHWITDDQSSSIVVAAGSFQDELGCPGDWLPNCLRSLLVDPDGNGIHRFETTALPAGDYETKVAIGQSWDENYGAGGVADGANIPFTVPADGARMVFQYDQVTHVLTVAAISDVDPAEIATPVVQHPVEDEVFYFLIPDRFADGDFSNNCGAWEGTCLDQAPRDEVLEHGYLPGDRGYYHGGDLAGLLDHLPYLKAMGVTALWVGPIYWNQAVQEDISNLYGHSSGYHGYWILDFLQVDPHLGTNEEFRRVTDRAHELGIDVFMDIITNHSADVIKYDPPDYSYASKEDAPYLDVDGNPFDDSEYAYYGQDDDAFPEMDLAGFPRHPVLPAGTEDLKNPAWLNDPLNYHNRGNTSFTGENSLYGDFFGLDDLFTERREVVEGMTDIYTWWIQEFGVDGFRIDTTNFVNMEFWQYFGPAVVDAAAWSGNDDFFAFGEVAEQQFGPQFWSEFSTRGKLQACIDFGFQLLARNYVSAGGSAQGLRALFAADDWYIDADSNAYAMPTFLGNHDMGRIGYFLEQDNPDADDGELLARSRLAHALMFFARGQPVLYYGDEQGFTGDGGDKLAREDMFPSTVPEYNDNDLIGTDATTADDNFDRTHPLYQAIRRFSQLYRQHSALNSGAQIDRYAADGPGIYAFSRVDRDSQVEYVVAVNNADTSQTATIPTDTPGTLFRLLNTGFVGGAESSPVHPVVRSGSDGGLDVTVPAFDVTIFKADSPIPSGGFPPTIDISTLADGQVVELDTTSMDGHDVVDRMEIGAEVTADGPVEVTFAVRETGSGEYTVAGTDDNAPYRVFYDTTVHGDRTPLDVIAVVRDQAGNVASSDVLGVVPTAGVDETVTYSYAVVHYQRDDGDYGDHTTGEFNDFWGLHAWGDIGETIEWTAPKPFLGEDDYGRFAWLALALEASSVGVIVHRGDAKDGTDADRFFDPSAMPEIWLRGGDPAIYPSQAAAQGYVVIHYQRPDGVYTDWGLHLWGEAIDPSEATEWTSPKPPTGIDDFGAYWTVLIQSADGPVNFIVHRGDEKDPGPDQFVDPSVQASAWVQSGDSTVYDDRGGAEGEQYATIHYRRPSGDYGDYASSNYEDFWGLHTWEGAADPGWTTPRTPVDEDLFGVVFEVPLVPGAEWMGYILHRGDEKDPGPDQTFDFGDDGYEVWQLQGADPANPYVLPVPR
jgi:glycosidase